jgi:hypothetical protein
MERMMSKTNDTSKFDHAKLENRVLADSDLDAVSGGAKAESIPIPIGPAYAGDVPVVVVQPDAGAAISAWNNLRHQYGF